MVFLQLKQQLKSLYDLLTSLSDEQYRFKSVHLGQSSIGAHTRHIIELLKCAIDGYEMGRIDYINRERNFEIQESKCLAQEILAQMMNRIVKEDRVINLAVEGVELVWEYDVSTTYLREIVYNTEHTVHHLALIKVALIEMKLDIVNSDFGMAYSTLKFNKAILNS